LEDFFGSVGTVRDVRIITDSKTRKSKGIAYVEFWEREGVPLVSFAFSKIGFSNFGRISNF